MKCFYYLFILFSIVATLSCGNSDKVNESDKDQDVQNLESAQDGDENLPYEENDESQTEIDGTIVDDDKTVADGDQLPPDGSVKQDGDEIEKEDIDTLSDSDEDDAETEGENRADLDEIIKDGDDVLSDEDETLPEEDAVIDEDECVPLTMAEICGNSYECGSFDDNCGGTISCGECAPSHVNTTAVCTDVTFICVESCGENYYDLNSDGDCEYNCVLESETDEIDNFFKDSNCDGVDGNIKESVFVAIDGNDNDPGTMELPKLTITAAIAQAKSEGKKTVLISKGDYYESVVLADGVSIYGGYDRDSGWERGASNVVNIRANDSEISGDIIGVTAHNLTQKTVMGRMNIFVGANSNEGGSNYGIHLHNSVDMEINNVIVIGSKAGDGEDGMDGEKGENGLKGITGANGIVGSETLGGEGAPAPLCLYGVEGYHGGKGGDGGSSPENGMRAEENGAFGGLAGEENDKNGLKGEDSLKGEDGSDGVAGAEIGEFIGGFYIPEDGQDGKYGTSGKGGGGGGAAYGGIWQELFDTNHDLAGGAGGGGGSGGCAGEIGYLGKGGGGFFGIFIFQSSVSIYNSTINAGFGGNGGAGGEGGFDGDGGLSGVAGQSICRDNIDGSTVCTGFGGVGGAGGAGGDGGSGAGGTGGPSYCVYMVNPEAAPKPTGYYCNPKSASSGGVSPGNQGSDGVSAENNWL